MKILITGGAGFVGSNLALQLKTKYPSYSISCLDNLKRRGSELNIPRLNSAGILFFHGDIRNPEDLQELETCDIIIDASAEPSVMAGITSPVSQVVNNNFIGTVNCLELAKKWKAAFIFLSTSRVYPVKALEAADFTEEETRFVWSDKQSVPGISSKGVAESFPLEGARSFYGTTKLASELLIQEYQEYSGLKAIINRFGVITGPWQMGKVDQGVMVLWVARHFWKGELGYFGYGGEGKQVRDMLHIDDVFNLIDLQLHDINKFSGKIMNVGGGIECSVSLQELTAHCEKITGNSINIKKVKENRAADIRIYITDNSYITELCGWKPLKSPEDIIRDIYTWLKENQELLKPILN